MFQEVCLTNVDWDSKISGQLKENWQLWVLHLFEIHYKKTTLFHLLWLHRKLESPLVRKKLSIPRLELLGNLILSSLILTMLNAFQGEIIISCLHAWTDSKVSLHGLKLWTKNFKLLFKIKLLKYEKTFPQKIGVIVQPKLTLPV